VCNPFIEDFGTELLVKVSSRKENGASQRGNIVIYVKGFAVAGTALQLFDRATTYV
jgi:hypothetical protein